MGLVLFLFLTILLYFQLVIKLINPNQVKSVLPLVIIGNSSPCPYLHPEIFLSFSPCSVEKGNKREAD